MQRIIYRLQTASWLETEDEPLMMFDPTTGAGVGAKRDYDYFLLLSDKASSRQLYELSKRLEKYLPIYALWGLMYRNDPLVDSAFLNLFDRSPYVTAQQGCIVESGLQWFELTRYYFNRCCPSMVDKLDSIVLYTHHFNYNLLATTLSARVNPRFEPQVRYLAFTSNRLHAIFYMHDFYASQYPEEIKKAMFTFFKRTETRKRSKAELWKMLKILLSYNDPEINTVVVRRLKNIPDWLENKSTVDDVMKMYNITGYY
ncbi:MAG: hypothetical protein JNM41_05860 [Flavipsychrobacter sp.]|nr:hypothetical protein [Flavipsychrobacter sp.]